MRVGIFTDNDFDKVNGVTTTFRAALQSVPAGIHLRVYTAAARPVDTDAYLALRSIGMPIPFYREMRIYLPRLCELSERARADRIDLVHLTTPGPIGLAAVFVARRLGIPLMGSFHTDLAAYASLLSGSRWLGVGMREYMRCLYSRCARVLVPSEHTRRLLISARSNPRRIEVWPRGVDTAVFCPSKRTTALRGAWQVSDQRPALLYVGRVSKEKGLLLLPAISDRLHARGIEHRCIIVGTGPLLPELRALLPDAVFTGVLSGEALAEAFASADCFVFPSSTDTAGNVVLEAQASGLPVIVSRSGGPRENMVAGSTGAVCHGDDASDWSDAIAAVLFRPRRQRLSRSARQYALTRTWSIAMQPLYRAYHEVHSGTATAPSRTLKLPTRASCN